MCVGRTLSIVGLFILGLRPAAAGTCFSAGDCAGQAVFPSSVQTSPGQRYAEAQFAALFSIKYGRHFKVVEEHMSKEQYVLIQCGCGNATTQEIDAIAPLPSSYTRKVFQIPLDNVATESTVQLEFFKELGLIDRVLFGASNGVGACWVKMKNCNGGFQSSYGGNATLRAEQEAQVSAVFKDCYGNSCAGQPNVVHFSASQDPSPLNSAEHIKFIAAFFNKEREANQLFDKKVSTYQSQRVTKSPVPRVAWIQKDSWGSEYDISLAHYKTQFVLDAGGSNVNKNDIQNALPSVTVTNAASGDTLSLKFSVYGGNQSSTAAAFVELLKNVDVVIDETYASVPKDYTFTTFLDNFFLDASSTLPFVANKKVFRIDGAVSATDDLDWFESRLAKPELFLTDLSKAIHGGGGSTHFLRNVANNELPRQVPGPDQCGVDLPACGGTQRDIPLPGQETASGVGDNRLQAFVTHIIALLVALLGCADL